VLRMCFIVSLKKKYEMINYIYKHMKAN